MEMAARGHGRATALHSLFLKYLGRTRGVQKCGAVPHGSGLSRDALLLALQQAHDAIDVDGEAGPPLALVAVEVRLALGDNALGVAVDDALECLVVGLGDSYDLNRLRPLHTKRGPHRCRPLQVGDILRLAAPRRPRRLNVHVSRTLKAAASGK